MKTLSCVIIGSTERWWHWSRLSILPSATHAAANMSARGCLPENASNLRRVTVRFNGLEPAKDVARFYEKLRSLEALPCRELTLDKQILSEALMAADQRATPAPWVTEMDALICKLNPGGCAKGRPAAKTFVVPNVHQREKIDQAVWLEKTRKANLQFTRQLTKPTWTQRGDLAKKPQLVVPIREYSGGVGRRETLWPVQRPLRDAFHRDHDGTRRYPG